MESGASIISVSRAKQCAALLAVVASAAVCIALPWRDLLSKAFVWHLHQPDTVQGGIELLAFFCGLSLAFTLIRPRRLGVAILILIGSLYLQMHSVLVCALAALVYLETLIGLGGLIHKALCTRADLSRFEGYLGSFIVGTAAWTVGALILSSLGFGTVGPLRAYTAAVLILVLVLRPSKPLSMAVTQRLCSLGAAESTLSLFVLTLLLAQFGKINYGIDYDSLWYGLRPERVLIGANSFFDNLRLVNFVYYYPKQFEFLSLPLSAPGKHAFIPALNVLLLAIGFLTIFRIFRELGVHRGRSIF